MLRIYPLCDGGSWEAPIRLVLLHQVLLSAPVPRRRGMGTGKFAETGRSVGELRTKTPGLPQDNWCRVAHRAPRRPRAPGHWRPGTPKTHAVGEGHAPRGHGHGVPPTPAEPRPLADPSSEGKGRRARKGGGVPAGSAPPQWGRGRTLAPLPPPLARASLRAPPAAVLSRETVWGGRRGRGGGRGPGSPSPGLGAGGIPAPEKHRLRDVVG